MKSIRNKQLLTWPGIELINFEKYMKDNVDTPMGHLSQERKGLRSTKTKIETFDDMQPKRQPKQFEVMSKIIEFNAKEMAYGDITSAFPYTSTRGNKYIYLMYDYDSNAVMVKALPNRQAATIRKCWDTLHLRLTQHGHTIKHFILDNEISEEIKTSFRKYNITFQCVPPHTHRRNAAERSIQTFKCHFLSGLATCNGKFFVKKWDRLLVQAELLLNLLRTARANTNSLHTHS